MYTEVCLCVCMSDDGNMFAKCCQWQKGLAGNWVNCTFHVAILSGGVVDV